MDKKVLEVLNQFLALSVYTFILSKSIKSECFSMGDNLISLAVIMISIAIMFYNWKIKE